jgi:solute carrier family 25, member 33/36
MVMRGFHFWMYHLFRDRVDAWRRKRIWESQEEERDRRRKPHSLTGKGAPYPASEAYGHPEEVELPDNAFVHLFAASAAGFVVHTVSSPIWLVKTRLQLQSGDRIVYNGAVDCVRKVYAGEGLGGFYKGLTASYVGLSETALQFAMYERMKREMQRYKFRRDGPGEDVQKPGDISLTVPEYLTLASASKFLACLVTYPHEVVRTRLREQTTSTKYRGFMDTLKVIAREEGKRGLYGGMGAHMLRVVPNAAILFVTYENVMTLLASQFGKS